MTKIYYVITTKSDDIPGYAQVFYTENQYIAKAFIIQNIETELELTEYECESTEQLQKILKKEKGIYLDEDSDLLDVLETENTGNTVITSMSYYDSGEFLYLLTDITRVLISSLINMTQYRNYINDEYRKTYDIYLSLIYKYACRMIIYDNSELYSIPQKMKKELSVTPETDYYDIIDEVLLFYMYERGWE